MYYSQDFAIANDECDKIISEFSTSGYENALVGAAGNARNEHSQRSTAIHWVDPTRLINRAVYGLILEANNKFFKYHIQEHERLQFSKYEVGDFFDWHCDLQEDSTDMTRKLSATLILSDPNSYEGGVLEFFAGTNQPIKPPQNKGTIIIFDSREWHRVTKVTKGIRYSLVLWSRGFNFK